MAIANDVFYSVVAEKTLRSEVFAGVVDDVLEGVEGNRDVVFVGFSFLGYGFRDALAEGPDESGKHGMQGMYLCIVLTTAAAGLDEYETLGAVDLVVTECPALAVLDCQVVRGAVNVLERRENLGELALDDLVEGEDVFERGQGEDDVVGGLGSRGGEDGDGSDDAEGAFCADKELF
ncbi:hypothetical protein C0992_001261 [Termitomyces sp. T32_za158]|nr:hypothetical protein C0992_001261 [Termitomyces sp. T32_za158]